MADLRSLSRDFLTEFIDIYKENPCLWQVKNKDYSNKQKKNGAYQQLIKKLNEVEKNATKDSVVKKINSLRTCFRKEYRKVLASEKSGTGTDDLYIPTLWYYDLLLFLIDQEEPRPSISNVPDEEVQNDIEEVLQEQNTQSTDVAEDETQRSTPDYESAPFSPAATSSVSKNPSSRAQKRVNKADAVLDIVAQKLQTPVENPKEFDNYAKHVAEQMRQVPKDQAIFLTKIINDAIFEAQCGTLTKNARIVTSNNTTGIPVAEHRYLAPPAPVDIMQLRNNTSAEPVMHNLQPVTDYYSRESDNPGSNNNDYQRQLSATLADYFSKVAP